MGEFVPIALRFFGFGDTSGFCIDATRIGGFGFSSGRRSEVDVERTGGTGRCSDWWLPPFGSGDAITLVLLLTMVPVVVEGVVVVVAVVDVVVSMVVVDDDLVVSLIDFFRNFLLLSTTA